MGCDIHTRVQRRTPAGWEDVDLTPEIFEECRSYSLFGWLNNVRNYSAVPPFPKTVEGLPDGLDEAVVDGYEWLHSVCHIYTKDLLSFDYQAMTEDRRVTINHNGGCTCEPGKGEVMSFAVFLGPWVLAEILRLAALGDTRILIGFDS